MSKEQLETLVATLRAGRADSTTSIEDRRAGMKEMGDKLLAPPEAIIEEIEVAGCWTEWVYAPGCNPSRQVLFLHGGGYAIGSPHSHRLLAYNIAKAMDARVLVIDYRMAPEDPFPAAVDDAVAAWKWMLDQGGNPAMMAIMGDSAGGGLAIATQVVLKNQGIALPACSCCISPWIDLEVTGESIVTNADADPSVAPDTVIRFSALYRDGTDPRNPLVSPLYADLSGLPPILIQVGTAEILMDDSTRLAVAARSVGVDVTLELWDDMPHIWHIFAPMLDEGQQAIVKLGAWARERTG